MPNLPKLPRNLEPTCDGKRYRDSGKRDALSVARRRYLRAYTRINQTYARLLEFRKRQQEKPKSARAEHQLLRAIEKSIVAREALDARYAPLGFLARAEYRNGFTVDVNLIHGNSPRRRAAKAHSSAQTTLTFTRPTKGGARRVP